MMTAAALLVERPGIQPDLDELGWSTTDLDGLLADWPTIDDPMIAGMLWLDAYRIADHTRWPADRVRAWLRVLNAINADGVPHPRPEIFAAFPADPRKAVEGYRTVTTAYLTAAGGDDTLARLALTAGLTPTELADHVAVAGGDPAALQLLAALR